MQSALHEYVLEGRTDIYTLNVLLDIVNARISTGQPYVQGALMDQPYFLVAYIEPWVKEAYGVYKAMHKAELEAMGILNAQEKAPSVWGA